MADPVSPHMHETPGGGPGVSWEEERVQRAIGAIMASLTRFAGRGARSRASERSRWVVVFLRVCGFMFIFL